MNDSVSVPDHQTVPLLLKGVFCLKGKIAPPSVVMSLDMIYSFRQETCTETRHEMSILRRRRVPLLTVCLALVTSAKAEDIFKYDVEFTFTGALPPRPR
jgi:hypothetical protein